MELQTTPADDYSVLSGDEDVARRIFETNFLGTPCVTKAFAPILAANGGGAILSVLSLSVWAPVPSAYAASKAAAWSATGEYEVLADDDTRTVKALLSAPVEDLNAALAEQLAALAS